MKLVIELISGTVWRTTSSIFSHRSYPLLLKLGNVKGAKNTQNSGQITTFKHNASSVLIIATDCIVYDVYANSEAMRLTIADIWPQNVK